MAKDGGLGAEHLGVTEIADMTGRSARWVQLLAKEGHFEKANRGRYRLGSVMHGLVAYYEGLLEARTAKAADDRVKEARADEIELRVQERRRELIEVDEAGFIIDAIVGVVNAELTGLPARMTRDKAQRQAIEAEVHGARDRIASAVGKHARALAEGGVLADPDAEDDA